MKRYKRGFILAFAAAMAVSTPVFAGTVPTGPMAQEEPSKYDEEPLRRLQDGVIEFDELQLLVHEYNPTMANAWKTYGDTKEDYKRMVTELENEYTHVKQLADSYISIGQITGAGGSVVDMAAVGEELDKGYRSIVNSIRKVVNNWDDSQSMTKQLRQAERQITIGVQSAMIGYDTIRSNLSTLQAMVELYEKQLAMTQRQVSLGMATQTELLEVQKNLTSGKASLLSLETQMESVRQTLCSLLGYDPDSQPEIRSLPEFDRNRISEMDLEEDTKKAIGNNTTLISQRTSEKGKTTYEIGARLDYIDEGDQKLTIEMKRLYDDVQNKKTAWEAAALGLKAAQSTLESADRMLQSGMISEMQQIGMQLSYYQKKAAYDTANLDLWQAMETYDWAILGFATIS